SVTSTDVNGDGKMDLIAANGYSDNVSVLINNGNGTFAAQTTYNVGDGPVSVTSTDVNGDGKMDLIAANYSSDNVSVLLNTTPIAINLSSTDDTGRSNSDNITNKTSLTLTGKGDSGTKVVLFDGSSNKGTATVTAAGSWSLKLSGLSQGSHSFTTQPLIDGQLGAASVPLLVTIDTTTPAVPTGLDLADDSDNGTSPSDNITSITEGLMVNGRGEAGASVTLYAGKNKVAEAIGVDGEGNWSATMAALSAGSYAITATQTDVAGNVSKASAALTLTVDTVAPAALTKLDLATADDSGANKSDNITGLFSNLTISAAGEKGARVVLFETTPDEPLASATVDSKGQWSADIAELAIGDHAIQAVQYDLAGNVSPASAALMITIIESTLPPPPEGLTLLAADDSAVVGDNITNKTSLTLTGNASGGSGAKVVLFDGSVNKGTATVSTAGSWNLKLSGLSQGSHSFTAQQIVAGETSNSSAPLTVVIDTTPPAVPTGLQSDASSGSGLLISGNGVEGATVTLFKDSNGNDRIDAGELLATVPVDGTSWAVGDVALPVGTHALKAIQTSVAGNVSRASAALAVVVRPENHPPSVNDSTRIGNEDAVMTLTSSAFSGLFNDPDGDALTSVRITDLPDNGTLQLNNEEVAPDQSIAAGDLASLIYLPNANWHGSDSFGWNGSDGSRYADTPATMAITINPVNDAPTLTGFSRSGQNDGNITFGRSDFSSRFSDPDGDSLASIRITSLSNAGTLKLNGSAVTSNQEMTASSLDQLAFVPADGSSGNTSFSVQASDGRAWSNTATVNLTITVDPTKPVVTVTNLKDQSTINSLLTIRGSASSQVSTIKSVSLQIFDQTGGTYMVRKDGGWLDVGTSSDWVTAEQNTSGSWQNWYLATPANSGVWTLNHSYLVTVRTEDMAGRVVTKAINFGYGNKVVSQVTLDKTLYTADENPNKPVTVSGQLSLASGGTWDFSDQTVRLRLIKPNGNSFEDFDIITENDEGHFSTDVPGSFFDAPGDYAVKVSYNSNSPLVVKSSQSEADVLVGAPVGYAIVVQGETLANGEAEGLLAHKRATNQVYTTLRQRGFTDDNINYLNFDDANIKALGSKFSAMDQIAGDHRDLPGARDDQSSRTNLQTAIEEWARVKLLASPAPLYIVMVDHGKSETFSMGSSYDNVTSTDLAGWLTNLDTQLKNAGDVGARALAQPQVAMLGFCNSGSFIDDLSRPGRVVISSATARELSYRNTDNKGKNNNIEHGELFLDHLFQTLATGKTLYDAFNVATRATENSLIVRGNRNNAAANTDDEESKQKIFDDSGQHPLLDDNGDKTGSNELSTSTGLDGAVATQLRLGITLSNSNSLTHPVQIGAVAAAAVLTGQGGSALLWLQEDDPAVKNGSEAWVTILKPDFSAPGSSGNNLQISFDLPTMPMSYNSTTRRWELNSSSINTVSFNTAGRYQVQYSVRDGESGLLATPMVGNLYRSNSSSNQAPRSFALQQPAARATINSVGPFDWDNSSDPDGGNNPVTYTLVIARDAALSQVIYRQEGLQRSHAVVNFRQLALEVAAGDYYWRVEAVDGYGASTPSNIGQFKLEFPNDIPAITDCYVHSNSDHVAIADATVTLDGTPVSMGSDGSLLLTLSTRGGLLKISKNGYRTQEIKLGAAEAGSVNLLSIGLDRDVAGVRYKLNGGAETSGVSVVGSSKTDSVTLLSGGKLTLKSVESVTGSSGNDSVSLAAAGSITVINVETVTGSSGADTITLKSTAAAVVIGGVGADKLTGSGSAKTTFRYTSAAESSATAKDALTNFTIGRDVIEILASLR
ncbi:MAG: VCBS repeat-containing protein, partial [Magnetococcales bacterium]|nr:VCBS repeat-containing protein [Magnetococcales bacterium]